MTKTTLSKASSKSDQLRTTVPTWLVEQYDLKPGDQLIWSLISGRETDFEICLRPNKVNG